jgi:hypothetical protein
METSPLPVKGCKIQAYARLLGPLSREGSLSCHTCSDTGPRFTRSHPKDRPIQSPLITHKGCGGFILTLILTNPHSVASYYTQRMWMTYSNPDPHRGFWIEENHFSGNRATIADCWVVETISMFA